MNAARTIPSRRKLLLGILCFGVILLSGPVGQAQDGPEQRSAGVADGQASRPASQAPEAAQEERDENEGYRQSSVVRTLGSKLGMRPAAASTLFEVINFAVLAVLFGWFLARALPKMFRDRTSSIQKSLVDARTATEEASIRLNSVEERLSKLDDQIAGMKAQAEKDAAGEEQRMKVAVEEEKRKILEATDQEIASATTQARREIQKYAADLAVDQAARKLVVSAETDRLLIQSFARRLGGDDSKEGQN